MLETYKGSVVVGSVTVYFDDQRVLYAEDFACLLRDGKESLNSIYANPASIISSRTFIYIVQLNVKTPLWAGITL